MAWEEGIKKYGQSVSPLGYGQGGHCLSTPHARGVMLPVATRSDTEKSGIRAVSVNRQQIFYGENLNVSTLTAPNSNYCLARRYSQMHFSEVTCSSSLLCDRWFRNVMICSSLGWTAARAAAPGLSGAAVQTLAWASACGVGIWDEPLGPLGRLERGLQLLPGTQSSWFVLVGWGPATHDLISVVSASASPDAAVSTSTAKSSSHSGGGKLGCTTCSYKYHKNTTSNKEQLETGICNCHLVVNITKCAK